MIINKAPKLKYMSKAQIQSSNTNFILSHCRKAKLQQVKITLVVEILTYCEMKNILNTDKIEGCPTQVVTTLHFQIEYGHN